MKLSSSEIEKHVKKALKSWISKELGGDACSKIKTLVSLWALLNPLAEYGEEIRYLGERIKASDVKAQYIRSALSKLLGSYLQPIFSNHYKKLYGDLAADELSENTNRDTFSLLDAKIDRTTVRDLLRKGVEEVIEEEILKCLREPQDLEDSSLEAYNCIESICREKGYMVAGDCEARGCKCEHFLDHLVSAGLLVEVDCCSRRVSNKPSNCSIYLQVPGTTPKRIKMLQNQRNTSIED